MNWAELNRQTFIGAAGPISAVVEGTGPLVILMHGWPELGYSYRHQVGPLVTAGYTVAVPDMRGYGASARSHDASISGIRWWAR